MKKIWQISERFTKVLGLKRISWFLILSTSFFSLCGLLAGILVGMLLKLTTYNYIVLMVLTTGYAGLFIGLFGGTFYIWRHGLDG